MRVSPKKSWGKSFAEKLWREFLRGSVRAGGRFGWGVGCFSPLFGWFFPFFPPFLGCVSWVLASFWVGNPWLSPRLVLPSYRVLLWWCGLPSDLGRKSPFSGWFLVGVSPPFVASLIGTSRAAVAVSVGAASVVRWSVSAVNWAAHHRARV